MENNLEVEVIKENEEGLEEGFKTLDDGSLEEVYRDKRSGNIVTPPKLRNLNQDNARREKCWDLYLQTVRDGNPNAYQSAITAGFAKNTAINVKRLSWFVKKLDKLRDSKMMTNSERNLQRFVNMSITKLKKLEDGTTEEVFDIEKAKLVADISKFILTTIGRDKYSTKTEFKVTALPTPIMEIERQTADVIDVELQEPNEVTE
jgi:hypothetical protein